MGKEGIIIIRQRQLENENENACAAAVVVSVTTSTAGLDWTDGSVRCFGLVRAEYNAGIETLNRDFWVLLGES